MVIDQIEEVETVMFTATQKHWVVGLILVGLAVGTLSLFAQAQEREPQPEDYYLIEFISGSMGALFGGGGAMLIAYGIAYLLFSPLYPCDQNCRITEEWIFTIAFWGGIAIGGTYGVVGAGSYKNVRGNTLAAMAGAILGEAVGLSIGFFSSGSLDHPVIFPLLVLFSALGATIGYNINATLEPIVLNTTSQGLIL
jgi:hypothetical protein